MELTIPDLSLVLLVGPSGCGKSTFARTHFRRTEILSSDFFRGLISDDEGNQAVSRDAFEVLHLLTVKRLQLRRFTVIDATNIKAESRRPLLTLARRYHYLTTAIVFNLPVSECQQRNRQRVERQVGDGVVELHGQLLQKTLAELQHERFQQVHILSSPAEVEVVRITRQRMPFDRRDERGPFDIIGDVHGCFEELLALLHQLGHTVVSQTSASGEKSYTIQSPPGRKLVFVGDLVDRGPLVPEVLRLVMDLCSAGQALCVAGNHDDKLLRYLMGREVTVSHGLAETLTQLEPESEAFQLRVRAFLDDLPSHYLLDNGQLVVAHAGLREDLQGRESKRVWAFTLYGETTGQTDEHGLPVRGNWGAAYSGRATVVYGHTPVAQPEWLNRTLNIDTGCVFGGRLTALRYPERELVSVPAARVYCISPRAFLPSGASPVGPDIPGETVTPQG